ILWIRLPGRRIPTEPIPDLAPDIAVEVLSASNTAAEMRRKLGEYFTAGTQSVWIVDPPTRSVRLYHSPDESTSYGRDDTITDELVLPGFSVSVSEIFKRAGLPDE